MLHAKLLEFCPLFWVSKLSHSYQEWIEMIPCVNHLILNKKIKQNEISLYFCPMIKIILDSECPHGFRIFLALFVLLFYVIAWLFFSYYFIFFYLFLLPIFCSQFYFGLRLPLPSFHLWAFSIRVIINIKKKKEEKLLMFKPN